MNEKKLLKKFLLVTLTVGILNVLLAVLNLETGNFPSNSIACAELKTYMGIDTAMSDFGEENATNVNTVKNMAKIRAEKMAQEKANIFVGNFAGNLTEDDIAAVTSNIAKVVDVQYQRLLYQAKDEQGNLFGKVGYMYEATVTLKIDTDGISEYINRNAQEKATLIEQNKIRQKTLDGIDKDFEDLRKNSANKTPEQIKEELEKINNRISNTQKNIAEENNLPQANAPMQFSQPVQIGRVFNTPIGGFIFDGVTQNNGSLYKTSKWQNEIVYGKGIARFGNGNEALYFYYDESFPYGLDANGQKCNAKFGDVNGKNAFSFWIREQAYFIEQIKTNNDITLYVLTRSAFSVDYTNYILLGRRKDGVFVKYFETDDIRQQYFGKSSRNGRIPFVKKLFCDGDTIVVEYERYGQSGSFKAGEFRFKWNDAAQWFSVENNVYNLNDITRKTYDKNIKYKNIPIEDDGKWKYPLVGASEGATFYLDPNSCNYNKSNGNAIILNCVVYTGGGGAALGGEPARISSANYQFETYKDNGIRKIIFKSAINNKNGENFTNYALEADNGFLLNVFWKAANYCNLTRELN